MAGLRRVHPPRVGQPPPQVGRGADGCRLPRRVTDRRRPSPRARALAPASSSHLWPVNAARTHHKWDTHRHKWDEGAVASL